MNSSNLKQDGFSELFPLKALQFSSLPKDKASILILADVTLTGKPASDILYIGKTKKPAKRVFGGYLAGYGGKATRKINSKLFDEGYIEKVAVSWILTDDPKTAQQQLLERFKKDHGEYPAWNAAKKTQKPKIAPAKPPKALKQQAKPKNVKPAPKT